MKACCFYLLFAAITIHCQEVYSQRIDEKLQAEANNLKAVFKDADIVALHSTSSYTMQVDKKSGALTARLHEDERFMAMTANATHVITSYFNDQSYIESYSLKTENGRNYTHEKFCGHYESDDIFYSDAQVCAYRLKLDVKGRSASYESSKVYRDPKYLTHVFFHAEVPARKRQVTIEIPDWVDAELLEKNFEGSAINKTVTKGNGSTLYTYTAENLEAFPSDKNLPGYLHFLPHILILTKSYQYNGQRTTILASTDDLYKWYASLTAQIKRNQEALRPTVDQLTAGLTKDEEKIKAIYYWVQDNIKYIAFEDGLAGFKPEDAHEVFFKRYGDCKGMANLAKEMLILAGFDARLTWIGTDRIPYTTAVPSLAVNNHMICTVMAGNKRYILDPTEKYNPIGTHGERIQGKEILIEDGRSYLISKVPEDPLNNYLQEWNWKFEIADQALKGKGDGKVNGEYKKILLNIVASVKTEDHDKLLKSIVSGSSNPDNFKIKDHSPFDREKPLSLSYDMLLKNNVSSYGKELYVDLDYTDDFKDARLENERKAPYKFGTKVLKKIRAELTIPSGYKVEYLPEAFHVSNDHYTFDMRYTTEGNKVIYTKEIKINTCLLPVSEFEKWNTTVESLTQFYNDQIILEAHD